MANEIRVTTVAPYEATEATTLLHTDSREAATETAQAYWDRTGKLVWIIDDSDGAVRRWSSDCPEGETLFGGW